MPAGSKILVVEDNYLLAEFVCAVISECGMDAVGPAADLETGLEFARQSAIDGAVLDINLNGQLCFPICDALQQRGIPFAFLTGYSDVTLVPQQYKHLPLIIKPVEPGQMKGVIEAMLSLR